MIVNLCFHGIGDSQTEREAGEANYWISERFFLAILDEVRRCPSVRLSFDDGNKSDISVALPALVERGLRAEFFPLAGRLDDPLSLDASDLREIRHAGMKIGSHGWAHVPWRRLSDRQARRELSEARAALSEASGGAIDSAALPLGRYDARLLRRLKSLGYRTVYTSDRRPATEGSWLQPRYSVRADDTLESIRAAIGGRIGLPEVRSYVSTIVKRMR